jgi:hypothetical protein
MLNHPTLDQLHALGLSGMAKAFADVAASGEADAMSHAEWLGLLLDREVTDRYDKRLMRRLRYARLRQQASVEDVNYRSPRGLDRAMFHKLAGGSWIDAHDNLVITGPTGVGKSFLASALGQKACRDNHSVLYQRVPKLFGDLAPWPAATAVMADCFAPLVASTSLSSMTGVSNRSHPKRVMTCWKFSRNATAGTPLSSPANSPWTRGIG